MRVKVGTMICSAPRVRSLVLAASLAVGYGAAHAEATLQHRTAAEYRLHLDSLGALVEQCRGHLDAEHCSPNAVGADDLVSVEKGTSRSVSYGWLRSTLTDAGTHKLSTADTMQMLQAAEQRIQSERLEAPASAPTVAPSYVAEHSQLDTILKRREFHHADRSLTQRVLEAVAIWINLRLANLAEYSSHRRWLGLLLEWGLLALAATGLAFWFVRQARRARRLAQNSAGRTEETHGLRDWEHLRRDAELAARQQRWRDAIRAYYWATIARFESRGQWPPDRARTPREYLRLMQAGHPKRDDLRMLTHRFESCWYGSATATEPDSEAARQLFERLVAR